MTQAKTTEASPRIFLSYSTHDRLFAARLRRLLSRQLSMRVFSTDSLSAGEDWAEKLKAEIAKCDVFVVVLSSSSLESKWVLPELGAAWALKKPILPVVMHPQLFEQIPIDLRPLASVDSNVIEEPDAMNQLIQRLRAMGSPTRNGGPEPSETPSE